MEQPGTGVSLGVTSLAVSAPTVYVGGNFTAAGGQPAFSVARWNTATGSWSALGTGLAGGNRTARALLTTGTDVYVGGAFQTAGGQPAANIARWNSATGSWSSLEAGTNSMVTALAVSGNRLYVGGGFTQAGGQAAGAMALWSTLADVIFRGGFDP